MRRSRMEVTAEMAYLLLFIHTEVERHSSEGSGPSSWKGPKILTRRPLICWYVRGGTVYVEPRK